MIGTKKGFVVPLIHLITYVFSARMWYNQAMGWKRIPYWLRGGLLAPIVAAVAFLLFALVGGGACASATGICIDNILIVIALPALLVYRLAPSIIQVMPWILIPLTLLLWPLIFFGVGAAIGLVYERSRSAQF